MAEQFTRGYLLIGPSIRELNVNYTYNRMKQIKVTVHKIIPIF
jgi:hypothetical protein